MFITRKGTEVTIEGETPKLGDQLNNFTLLNQDAKTISLNDYRGKVVILSTFPDINTRVCDLQTKRFFNIAATLKDTVILNMSTNSAEQFKDWCATSGVDAQMLTLTDPKLAVDYGIWLPELELLARSVFVIDQEGLLKYIQIVPELTEEPNYQAAIDVASELTK